MATQEERHLLQYLNDPYTALGGTGQLLIEFRKNLFSGKYRKNFLNSKGKFDADLRYLGGVFANSDRQVLDAIELARANNIMPAFIDNIHNLNENMAESYEKVITASQDRALEHRVPEYRVPEYRALEHRAQISVHVEETINSLS